MRVRPLLVAGLLGAAGCAAPPEALLDAAARGLACCRVCRVGKPCGDACIARDAVCAAPEGCACAGVAPEGTADPRR
mgnify:CR=1 FL=1